MKRKIETCFFEKVPLEVSVTQKFKDYLMKSYVDYGEFYDQKKLPKEEDFLLATLEFEKIAEFLQAGADPNIVLNERNGNTLLHILVNCSSSQERNDAEIDLRTKFLKILLEHGANVDALNKKLRTPLIIYSEACFSDSPSKPILSILLKHEANTLAQDYNGDSSLHIILSNYISQRIEEFTELQQAIRLLLCYGADISLENKEKETVIDVIKKEVLEQQIEMDAFGLASEKKEITEWQNSIITFIDEQVKTTRQMALEFRELKRKTSELEKENSKKSLKISDLESTIAQLQSKLTELTGKLEEPKDPSTQKLLTQEQTNNFSQSSQL